jgi:hypothetical protein
MACKDTQTPNYPLKEVTYRFGDTLDVIPENFTVTLSTPLAQSLETRIK